MIKTFLIAALATFTLLFASNVQADELLEFTPRDRAPLSVHESGAAVSFMGESEEGGLLEVFVRKNNNLQPEEDALARELDSIKPAAGVQFRMEF